MSCNRVFDEYGIFDEYAQMYNRIVNDGETQSRKRVRAKVALPYCRSEGCLNRKQTGAKFEGFCRSHAPKEPRNKDKGTQTDDPEAEEAEEKKPMTPQAPDKETRDPKAEEKKADDPEAEEAEEKKPMTPQAPDKETRAKMSEPSAFPQQPGRRLRVKTSVQKLARRGPTTKTPSQNKSMRSQSTFNDMRRFT